MNDVRPPESNTSDLSDHAAKQRFVRPKQSGLIRFGKRLRDPVNAWFAKESLIGDDVILDPSVLPSLNELAQNWETVRDELWPLIVDRKDIPAFGKISPDHRRIASSGHWKSFFFGGYGLKLEANRAKCPQTAAMLDRIPGLIVAFFSIMEPGTEVPRHRGLTKAWLNCHLPLVVPQEGRCEMQVSDETVSWRPGEWLIFDETNPHQVSNRTNEVRVVLFLQVMRPMTRKGTIAARALKSIIARTSFVRDIRKALADQRDHAAEHRLKSQ